MSRCSVLRRISNRDEKKSLPFVIEWQEETAISGRRQGFYRYAMHGD